MSESLSFNRVKKKVKLKLNGEEFLSFCCFLLHITCSPQDNSSVHEALSIKIRAVRVVDMKFDFIFSKIFYQVKPTVHHCFSKYILNFLFIKCYLLLVFLFPLLKEIKYVTPHSIVLCGLQMVLLIVLLKFIL